MSNDEFIEKFNDWQAVNEINNLQQQANLKHALRVVLGEAFANNK